MTDHLYSCIQQLYDNVLYYIIIYLILCLLDSHVYSHVFIKIRVVTYPRASDARRIFVLGKLSILNNL